MKKIINLNIACGEHFIINEEWINLDYEAISPHVIKCDILNNLPLKENSASNIYTSHFVEHIPYSKLNSFLKNCFKILSPGGVIRIITPDFNEMCESYIKAIKDDEKETAEFIKIEILDQLVRVKKGGALKNKFNEYIKFDNKKMINVVRKRLGCDLKKNDNSKNLPKKGINQRIFSKIFNTYINLVSYLLPKAFRTQNVKFTSVGENHTWIWDNVDLSSELLKVGFTNIINKDINESGIENYPYELDIENGYPRKGFQSMCIEAEKK